MRTMMGMAVAVVAWAVPVAAQAPAAGEATSVSLGAPLWRMPASNLDGCEFSHDGTTVLLAMDHRFGGYDPATRKELWAVDIEAIHTFSRSADGRVLAAPCGLGGTGSGLEIWDLVTHVARARLRLPEGGMIMDAACSPDGKWIVCAGGEGVHLVSVATGKIERSIPSEGVNVWDVEFLPDGHRFVWREDGDIVGYDLRTSCETFRASVGACMAHLVISPDGRLIGAASAGSVVLVDSTTGHEVRRVRTSDTWIYSLAFAPDGASIAYGTNNNDREAMMCGVGMGTVLGKTRYPPDRVRFLEVATGRACGERYIASDGFGVRELVYSPDGTRLLVLGQSLALHPVVKTRAR